VSTFYSGDGSDFRSGRWKEGVVTGLALRLRAGSPSDAAKASEINSVIDMQSTGRVITGTKLFVDGLPRSFDDQQLHDLFAGYGQVVSARILTSVSARLPLAGYVVMASAEETDRAIEALDRTRLNGQWLLVGRALVHR
jgi:RNA recognition motif-containing protein